MKTVTRRTEVDVSGHDTKSRINDAEVKVIDECREMGKKGFELEEIISYKDKLVFVGKKTS